MIFYTKVLKRNHSILAKRTYLYDFRVLKFRKRTFFVKRNLEPSKPKFDIKFRAFPSKGGFLYPRQIVPYFPQGWEVKARGHFWSKFAYLRIKHTGGTLVNMKKF